MASRLSGLLLMPHALMQPGPERIRVSALPGDFIVALHDAAAPDALVANR